MTECDNYGVKTYSDPSCVFSGGQDPQTLIISHLIAEAAILRMGAWLPPAQKKKHPSQRRLACQI